jgi:hypothetical protein
MTSREIGLLRIRGRGFWWRIQREVGCHGIDMWGRGCVFIIFFSYRFFVWVSQIIKHAHPIVGGRVAMRSV